MEVIKMQKKFSGKTDVQKVKQLNQQAESNKQQASGRFGQQNTEEFGAETDVQAVKKANQQAEAKKQQASGNTFGSSQQS
ncbi:gamma-type small acid-soluble spore protein [Rummeliibacillus sp. TYF005]|nr:gamma-type small acid-soluble spore protein [Rummeliibacillus sp. POC4]RPJ95944.1 gamma-type small acid-soluble spore protein [Rummeliibacillus sp. TYF005]